MHRAKSSYLKKNDKIYSNTQVISGNERADLQFYALRLSAKNRRR